MKEYSYWRCMKELPLHETILIILFESIFFPFFIVFKIQDIRYDGQRFGNWR